MFPLEEGQGSTGRFRSSSVVVLIHAAVLLLLTRCCEGQSQVIGPPQPIITFTGEDVILPCHLKPSVDAASIAVEWSRQDLSPRFVHVRRSGQDLLVDQNPAFEGRTSVLMDRLRVGDVSLKLSRVKVSDGGTYRCFIPGLNKDVAVQLIVGSVSSPAITGVYRSTDGVVLQCQSEGWYPEPEVSWLDGEDKHVSAVKTETVRGPDGLYTVSSGLSVEERHSNNFTCRVQQRNINQTRETTVQISGVVFSQPSYAVLRITLVLFAVVLFFTATLVLWKFRQNKSKNKKHRDSESPGGEEEDEQQLMTEMKEMKDEDDEKIQDKDEEKKVLTQVISVLENQKKELEAAIEKHQTRLDQLEKEWRENEKKLEKKRNKFSVKQGEEINSLLKDQIELERQRTENQTLVPKLSDKLQKINEALRTTTERKEKVEKQIEEMKKLFKETKMQRDRSQRKDQPQTQRKHQSQTQRDEEKSTNTDSVPEADSPE